MILAGAIEEPGLSGGVMDLVGVAGLVGKMEVYNVYICRYKVGIENSSIYIYIYIYIYISLIDLFEKMEVYNM